jgi:predicted dehydrogenase
MRSSPFALGFIGGSLRSAVGYAHRVSCTMDERWGLVAGCFSRNESENRATASAYGVAPERTYATWQDMLSAEMERLDAVVVLTPTPTHAEIVAVCLRAGMPVICEKSLAADVDEARRILTARDEAKGFLAITYNYSGYPMVRELRNLIRRGVLGRILHFQAEMPQEGFRRVDAQGKQPVPQAWRLSDRSIPVIYLDLGVHLHHVLHYLTEQHPLEVVADQRSYGWFEVMDNVTCLCRYTDGIQGQIWFSKSALGQRNGLRFRIYGSEASAEWYQANPEEVVLSFVDGRRQILDRAATVEVANLKRYNRFKAGHPAGFIEAFANLYGDIADALALYQDAGTWVSDEVFSADLAAEGLLALEAMVRSSHSGSWEKVGKLGTPNRG